MVTALLDIRPDAALNQLVPPYIRQVAERVRDEATVLCPRGPDHPTDRLGRAEQHPLLWTTIDVRPGPEGSQLVGSNEGHAFYVHEGTEPHYIAPRIKPRLVFWWKAKGRIFVGDIGQATRHPGTRPNRFLLEAARRVLGR